MSSYAEEEYLPISGIQHFAFCRRQWALIYLEQQWTENLRTVEGELLHQRPHDESRAEKRGGLLTLRGMRVSSAALGVAGTCDVVEFLADKDGAALFGREGKWRPYLVEYKRGRSKESDVDRLQLCCQAMCLEEMLAAAIPEGSLFYGEPRRRERVALTAELRGQVREMAREMHEYARRGHTPRVKTGPSCRACSLQELCLPRLYRGSSAVEYLRRGLEETA